MSILLSAFAVISCSEENEPAPDNKEAITIAPNSIEVAQEFAETKSIKVTTKVAWTLTGTPADEWVKPSIDKGVGTKDVVFTFKANASNERSVKFTFKNVDGKTATLNVKQAGKAKEPIPTDKVDMILVEGGTFTMGNPDDAEKSIAHEVTVSSFSIGKYEITQGQYEHFMGKNPSKAVKGDNYPVTDVTRVDARAFCNAISKSEGLTEAYDDKGEVIADATGYRLPYEAEFEYAARGGKKATETIFAGSDDIDAVAVHGTDGEDAVEPSALEEVGSLAPNELGLYDMSGNCWEMLNDWYEEVFSADAVTNPTGPASGDARVLRSGAFDSYTHNCKVFGRFYIDDASAYDDMSFRIVKPVIAK